ncbi:MAG TPA: PHB depolymerase family esterase [Bacteroidales bacterium]
MKRILLTLLLASIYLGSQAQLHSFIFEGIERTYRLHLPDNYDENQEYPLVINMHGLGSNSFEQQVYTGFDLVADTAGVVVVYPDGVNNQWNVYQDGGVNDVGFISALIDTMDANYSIDLLRVYACGMSMGGFMSHRLACQLNNRIAAIGSVTGLLVYFNCDFSRNVPILQIHGTSDDIVPYDGVAYTMQFWTDVNGCPDSVVTELPDIDTTDQSTVTLTTYSPCLEDSEVLLYTINGGEHTWPGAKIIIGITNQDINASVEIWSFFKKFSLPTGVGFSENYLAKTKLKIYPQPAIGQLTIEVPGIEENLWKVNLYDLSGRLVKSENAIYGNKFSLSLNGLKQGLYIVELSSGTKVFRDKIVIQ